MMRTDRKLNLFLAAVLAAGAAGLALTFQVSPPEIDGPWLLAFFTLLFLAIVGAALGLQITEGGSTTSMLFVPQLGAIPLLGPFGAALLTLVAELFTEFLLAKKPTRKAVFNTSQVVLAISVAGSLYVGFGAAPSLADIDFARTFPQFVVAAVAYFAVNTVSVSYVIALAEGQVFREVWSRLAGSIVVFDLAMSSLGYLVAFLYVQWGAVALLAIIIPIIGLRYSYGVTIQLQQLNQDLLRVLIKALEARDRYTSGHSVRVAERSKRIAQALGVPRRQIQLIETAALLHDIGKVDLAYGEILRQAGPLTPAQRQLIQAHPDKGVEIIKAVRSLDREILRCVRHHHEWYDGSGYPLGITDEDIPLGARIIMISDSIDAMLTDRPYRAALSIDQVQEELVRNSGTQFDPEIVEVALEIGVLEEAARRAAIMRPMRSTLDREETSALVDEAIS